jgi:hypothetical protein
MSNIPWHPDEHDCHIRAGDWIANPTPNSGNSLDWVYQVFELTHDKALVIKFKKTTPNGCIQAIALQALTISMVNYCLVIVLSQEKPGTTLKVTREPPAPGKNPFMYWIFETCFIQDLPWDPGEWHWWSNPPLGNSLFFGYTTNKGYTNIRKTTHTSNMQAFFQGLNLRNTTNSQMIAKLWHNAGPRKVGTLIGLTLNKRLLVGTWLELMGISPQCKVCDSNSEESLQHCLLECPMGQCAWKAFKRIWVKWQAPQDLAITWPFAQLGEAVIK